MKKIASLFLALTLVVGFAVAQTADLSNCKQTCEVVKLVEEGPLLGVQIKNGPNRQNAQVIRVLENTQAEKHGFAIGDIITKVDGEVVKNNYHLVQIIQAHQPGDKVMITYVRDGKETTDKVRIGAKSVKTVTETICCDEEETAKVSNNDLSLFPNPVVDEVSVKIKKAFDGEAHIQIIDVKGQIVKDYSLQNQGKFNEKINVNDLTSGQYFVRIAAAGEVYTEKFTIAK